MRFAIRNGMVPVGVNDYAFDIDFPFLEPKQHGQRVWARYV